MPTVDFNFNPIVWLTRMLTLVEQHGIVPSVETLAYSLAAMLFAYGMIRAIWYGRGSELAVLAGRTLLVVALMAMLPTLRSVVFNSWTSVYTWSSGIWGTSGGGTFDRLLSASEDTKNILPSFLASSYAVQSASTGQYDATTEGLAAEEPSDAATTLSKVVTWVAGVIFTVMLPVLFGVYTVVIFVSGMTVLIGLVLLPLAAVFLLMPGGSAVSWLGAWLRMNLGALFVVVFLPVAVSIVVELGIAQPLEHTNEAMQQSVDSFNGAVTSLDGAFQDLRDAVGQTGPLPGDAQATLERARQAFYTAGEQALRGVFGVLLGWLFGILTILVGFMMGLFLLLRMERYVMGFMGGLASGVGGPGFLGRALLYKALRSGGGGAAQISTAGSSAPRSFGPATGSVGFSGSSTRGSVVVVSSTPSQLPSGRDVRPMLPPGGNSRQLPPPRIG